LRPALFVRPAVVFGAFAILLVPWAIGLNMALPDRHVAHHWDIVWTGFDLALAAGLGAVAVAAHRRSRWLGRLAMTAGTLLLTDAWFDVLTADRGTDRLLALAALAVELPLAALCFKVAWTHE
jgi:hypothetical protein